MYFEKTCVVYFLNCKAFGGSRVKTPRCISRQEDVFGANLCCLLD